MRLLAAGMLALVLAGRAYGEAPDPDVVPTSLSHEQTEALLDAAMARPESAAAVWSAVICRWTVIRADAKREIETEKKYALEGGGVVDLASIQAEQVRMRRADTRIARARAELKEWKRPALPCNDKVLFAVNVCLAAEWTSSDLDDELRSTCSSLGVVLLKELVYRADSWLRR